MARQDRIDPTRTTLIRRQFMAEFRRRLQAVARAITQFIDTDDSFGLRQRVNPLKTMAREYAFLTDPQKLDQFKEWMSKQVDANLLYVDDGIVGQPWTSQYVESAHRRGLIRAYTDAHKEDLDRTPDFYQGTQRQFIRDAFAQPEMMSKIKMLQMRAFESMKGLIDTMKTQLNYYLAQGMARGDNPHTIAREMRRYIAGMAKSRAATIARTEIIRAHAEGQLDGFELLGIEDVGVMAEWSTAGDDVVCEMCGSLEGIVMKVKEARGLIPRHPNCRCAWIPANVGETESFASYKFGPEGEFVGGVQRYGKTSRMKALRKSLEAETGKKALAEARVASRWSGRSLKGGVKMTKTIKVPKTAKAKVVRKPKADVDKKVAAKAMPKPSLSPQFSGDVRDKFRDDVTKAWDAIPQHVKDSLW